MINSPSITEKLSEEKLTEEKISEEKIITVHDSEIVIRKPSNSINDPFSWYSCICSRKTDSRAIKYMFTIILLTGILMFCCFEINKYGPCAGNIYISLVSLICGHLLSTLRQIK